MSADFILSSQRRWVCADGMSPLTSSLNFLSLLPSPGYIKLNDRFARCCRFPKVFKENRLTDRPRQCWSALRQWRKEGREEGRKGGREGKPVIIRQEETYTVWYFIGNSSFSGKAIESTEESNTGRYCSVWWWVGVAFIHLTLWWEHIHFWWSSFWRKPVFTLQN